MIQLNKMLTLVAQKFDGKFDKGGKPYILHCLAVMQLTQSQDEEVMCIALGHDLVEDTDVTYEELREIGFSRRIIEGIKAMTKVPGESAKEYLAKILSNEDACIVKMADLTHNSDIRRLKGITEKDIARMRKYHEMYLTIRSHLGLR